MGQVSESSVFDYILKKDGGCLGALEGHGPLVEVEPASRVHFSNSSGGRLDCRGGGSPPPAVQWTLSDGGAAPTVSGLRYQLPNGSLVFPPFAAADFRPDVHRASYRCVLSSALGRAITRDVRLTAGRIRIHCSPK
ncbi:Down syndrome cell adhesion molecule-like protein Dscam2 [Frankliniella fusca]|uniref:Down syndrome cell adhesion molecule-like protein Dscam2 n=1 Tax=Frankliniella fusca TaxID=407009 RepID=A0AAE1LJP1_9NEOP|nr:Down syndrome cell adhesion molecule-like protein Dscam2 [Frankliniella fusca]